MLITNRPIRLSLTALALAIVGFFSIGTTLALDSSAPPATADSLLHKGRLPYILAQAPSVLPSAASTPKDTVPSHIIEQYKVYVTDLGNVGAQLGTTQTFYLTIVSALIAVLAFKETLRPIRDYFAPASIVVFVFIALVRITWWLTNQQFHNLVGAKFEVIREMEQKYSDLYPMFSDQSNKYKAHLASGIIKNQSMLIIVIGLGASIAAAFGIRWQIRNRRLGIASDVSDTTPAKTAQPSG